MPDTKYQIILTIDPKTYEDEAETPLTDERAFAYGKQANDDFAGVYGYEGWQVQKVTNVER